MNNINRLAMAIASASLTTLPVSLTESEVRTLTEIKEFKRKAPVMMNCSVRPNRQQRRKLERERRKKK